MEDAVKVFDEMSETVRQNALRIFVMHGNINEDTMKIIEKYPECFSHAYDMGNNKFMYFMHKVIDKGFLSRKSNRNNFVKQMKGKFVLSEETISLIDHCPRLLETSFDIDFNETMYVVISYINNFNFSGNHKEVFVEKCELYILEALAKNNYVLNELYADIRLTLKDPSRVIEISYENDPLNTVYELLKYPYVATTKEFLRDKNVYEMIMKDKSFVMSKDIYKSLSYFLSEFELEKLLAHSMKNRPFTTLINGSTKEAPFLVKNMNENKLDAIKRTITTNISFLNRSEKHTNAITNLVNEYPSIAIEALRDNYHEVGLKLLGSLKIDKLKENVLECIKGELRKHGYVAGYIDNNIYLLKPMFMESLQNNFNATMRVIKGVYASTTFYEEMLDEHGEKLSKLIIDNLSSDSCEGVDSICEFIKHDPKILIESMRINPKLTIENLSKVNRPTYLGELTKEEQKELEKYLIARKFLLSEGDNNLFMHMNSAFVFASLENDYDKTREVIMEARTSLTSTRYSEEEYKRIIKICNEHDDKELLFNICGKNAYLLGELIKDDLNLAYEVIDSLKKPSPLNKENYNYLLSVFNSVKVEKLDFINHPNLISLFAWGKLKDNVSEEEQDELVKQGISVNCLKLDNKNLMKKYLTSKEMNWQEKLYFDSSRYEYKREDEEELLKFLGSEFDCVEDELAYLHSKKVTRKDLSPSQMLLFVMFMKKDQFNKGVSGYSLRLYDYAPDILNLGSHNSGSKLIFLFNGQDGTVADLLRTIVHENNHAKQHLDTINCDVSSDKDIVLYAKDELLRTMLMAMYQFDFYRENYFHTLIERDADLKAIMEVAKILRIDPTSRELSNENVSSLDEAFLVYGMDRIYFDIKGSRTLEGIEYPLEDIFVKFLNICIKNKVTTVSNILRRYPIIDYEYNLCAKPIERKTITELMINYNHGNSMDKEIIRALFKHRFDGLYNSDYLSDIMELEKILLLNEINDTDLNILIADAYSSNMRREINGEAEALDKYLEYIHYMVDNDKKITDEKFSEQLRKWEKI